MSEEDELKRDREVIEYFKSLPRVGYINKEGYTVLPVDMKDEEIRKNE